MIAELSEDLRFGLRMLTKRPAFAAVAILSLALGIGANTAIFTLLDAVFFRPLAVSEPETLVQVRTVDQSSDLELGAVSLRNLEDIRAGAKSLEAIEGEVPLRVPLQEGRAAEPITVSAVTDGFFGLLGVEAARGRFIDARDAGSDTTPRIVLAHHLWKDRFDADPDILGRYVRIAGVDFEVIGVSAPDFAGLYFPAVPQAWVHHNQVYRLDETLAEIFSRRGLTHHSVARLREGVSAQAAAEELRKIGSELEAAFPEANRDRSFELLPVEEARVEPGMRPMAQRASAMLVSIVVFILVIACANVANLLLARSSERRREISVRLAVGATPRRILRQLLNESLLLGLIGGALGVVLALWGVDLIWAMQPGEHWEAPPVELGIDGRVLAFTISLSVATALIFGLLPAWRSAHEPLVNALRADAKVAGWDPRPPRLRRLLVAAQVGLSLVAMIGAGLFVRSLQNVRAVDPGFALDGTGVVELSLPTDFDRARREEIYDAAIETATAVPGVVAAGLAEDPPMRRSVMRTTLVEHEGQPAASGPIIVVNGVSANYFDAIELPLVRGEPFSRAAAERAQTRGHLLAIVNEAAAKKLWPKGEAIGSSFRFIGFPISHEVVGVVRDTKVFALHELAQPAIFVWMPQQRHPRSSVILRSDGDLEPVLEEVTEALRGLDPRVAVHGATSLRGVVEGTLWGDRLGAGLLSAFAGLALLLAGVGVYGLSSYVVTRRTREVGIRMALGADPSQLRRLLVRQTLAPVLTGVAGGLLLALAVSPLLRDMLFEVPLADPGVFLPASGLLILVATFAAWLPARRATSIDPMEALRR